jgi:hypothetical protein
LAAAAERPPEFGSDTLPRALISAKHRRRQAASLFVHGLAPKSAVEAQRRAGPQAAHREEEVIRAMPWYRAPSEPVRAALPGLRWQAEGELSAATSAAALMLYVALLFQAQIEAQEDGSPAMTAQATYDDLEAATGGRAPWWPTGSGGCS